MKRKAADKEVRFKIFKHMFYLDNQRKRERENKDLDESGRVFYMYILMGDWINER